MHAENADDGVLNALVFVAENLKLLIAVPVVAGLLAFGLSFALPRSYSSQAILDLTASTQVSQGSPDRGGWGMTVPLVLVSQVSPGLVASMMNSPLVLDQVLTSTPAAAEEGFLIGEAGRKALSRQIKTAVGKDGLLRVDVVASTPARAQALANALIEAWLRSTVPGARKRADLEKWLNYAQDSLDAVRRLREQLVSSPGNAVKVAGASRLVAPFEALDELQMRHTVEVMNFTSALNGVSREVVKQPPTLAAEPVAPRKGLIALLAALIAEFGVVLWLLVRKVWHRVAMNPLGAAQQARLLRALKLRA
ncbi:MAG: hypothetical protein O9312_06990 [Hylemonella sp.]|nr:hypothetical protein [Hylemonella sp.]